MVEKVSDEGAATQHAEAAPKEIRGRPFQPGNPGRPPGSKNRTTRLLEELVAGEGEKLIQKTVELALGGNVKCLQLCLDRLLPRRTGRPLDFTLPAVNEARDIVAAMAAITTAVNDGRLTAEEAGQWCKSSMPMQKLSRYMTWRPALRRLNRRRRHAHDARH